MAEISPFDTPRLKLPGTNLAPRFAPCPRCTSKRVQVYKARPPIRYCKCSDCGHNYKFTLSLSVNILDLGMSIH